MLKSTLILEQHSIFQRLQQVLISDKGLRAGALEQRTILEAAAEQERRTSQEKIERELNEVVSQVQQAERVLNNSGWEKVVKPGTAQSYLINSGASDEISQCLLVATRAQKDITAFIAKNAKPENIGSSSGCIAFILAVVLFIIIAASFGGDGTAIFIGFLIACALWIGAGLGISNSRKIPLYDAYATALNAQRRVKSLSADKLAVLGIKHQSQLAQVNATHAQVMAELDKQLPLKLSQIEPLFVHYLSAAGTLGSGWQQPTWSRWTPATSSVQATRFGEFASPHHLIPVVPAMIGCPGYENMLFKVSGIAKQQALQAIQSVMLRLLATQEPGKLRFTLLDPIGLGQNVAPFMQLADYDEKLVGSRAWSETKHIEQQLTDLSEHMGYVIQKYLRGQYGNIEDYNLQAGEVAEPYRILVVTGFPVKFSQEAATRLVEIATNGPRCGVFALVMLDTEQPLPYDFNIADLERVSTVITGNGQNFAWNHPDFEGVVLQLDEPPPLPLFNIILQEVGKASSAASEVRVPFNRVALPLNEWWKGSTRDGIHVPLGRVGATKLQYLDLGKGTAQHVLVAGKTGAGKTNLLHVLLINLALTYSPNELELYLIDFKTVGFTPYATFKLPHARVVATQSEREFAISVLQGLDKQLEQRKTLFSNAHVQDIAQFRISQPSERMPRVLLLVDEFQEFFTYDDKVAQEATLLLDRLVRQGRAFGIHVMLGSQTLAGAYMPARTTIGQMAVRIALQCEEADSRLILSDDNPAARLLSRAGEGIYNASNGLIEGNNPFQCAWFPEDELDRYLGRIYTYMQHASLTLPWQQIIFQGDADASIEKNVAFGRAVSASYTPSPIRVAMAWIGDPIAIKESMTVQFKSQAGNNLLMIGQQGTTALGMQITTLLSLASRYSPQQACFYIFDFTPLDEPLAGELEALQQLLPHVTKMVTRRTLPSAISDIYNELTKRMNANAPRATIYLYIYGLQRLRDLRPDEDDFSSFSDPAAPPSIPKQFSTILREGPELGIHTIAWCDTYMNTMRTLDRSALREFEMRIVFQMSPEDSSNLIDVPAASNLGPHRAFFYSEETGRLEKFRPYTVPSTSWLQQVATLIKQKSTRP